MKPRSQSSGFGVTLFGFFGMISCDRESGHRLKSDLERETLADFLLHHALFTV